MLMLRVYWSAIVPRDFAFVFLSTIYAIAWTEQPFFATLYNRTVYAEIF